MCVTSLLYGQRISGLVVAAACFQTYVLTQTRLCYISYRASTPADLVFLFSCWDTCSFGGRGRFCRACVCVCHTAKQVVVSVSDAAAVQLVCCWCKTCGCRHPAEHTTQLGAADSPSIATSVAVFGLLLWPIKFGALGCYVELVWGGSCSGSSCTCGGNDCVILAGCVTVCVGTVMVVVVVSCSS